MRRFAALALALALAPACKKDSSKGLPPATDWSGSGQAIAPSAPGGPGAGGPGMGGDPHAGMDMGGGSNPHAGMDMGGAVPQPTGPRTLEKLPDGRLALGPFSVALPAGWAEKPVTSSMRAAHLMLPGDAAGAEAELIVYYFGEDGAGSTQDNLDRWIDMFQQPDGKPSRSVAKIEKATFAGQEATLVTLAGRYVTTAMPGAGAAIDKPDQALIGAIIASPRGPYYWKLVGPKKTVDAQAAKVRATLAALKLR